uniref:putative site-specific DNA endonuclease n=1 Tax=Massjukichlorella minus TaxID=2650457 RepID=UPI0024114025|nr:putative site-specific DNA endonuclease [Massjukichlorella minus]WDY12948.1 putative site-specific DNA endonuclease [Massjukichlorella minus]
MNNSMLNSSDPKYRRKAPGIYMILCLINDYRYIGESSNISGRLASHKSYLRRNIHPSKNLQKDWNMFGEHYFDFVILYIGEDWKLREKRLQTETFLISQNLEKCYNILQSFEHRIGVLNPFFQKKHSEKTKQLLSLARKGIPNDQLGRKISIDGQIFPSIAEASKNLGHSRRLIRERVNSVDFPDWKDLSDF